MKIHTEIIGNIHRSEWRDKLKNVRKEYLDLDQWTAQKSRFTLTGQNGDEHAVSLKRHSQIRDGDILEFSPENGTALIIRTLLNDVMVIDLKGLLTLNPETIVRTSVEIGHAIGNQHWPAVVKGTAVYVPLTVDKRVMASVMDTHNIEAIRYSFTKGEEIIPYLAPHEIRRLFGGAGQPFGEHHEHHHVVHSH